MQTFRAYVQQLTGNDNACWDLLQACLTEQTYRKGAVLLQEGKICQAVYFIRAGCCKAVYNKDGKDINTAFYFEGDFATNIQSLQSGLPSAYQLKACEPVTVVRLDKEKLWHAYQLSHAIATFGRQVLSGILAKEEETANSFRLYTPRERFDKLVRERPDVLQRISLTQIASYLGISRETLSRFRARR